MVQRHQENSVWLLRKYKQSYHPISSLLFDSTYVWDLEESHSQAERRWRMSGQGWGGQSVLHGTESHIGKTNRVPERTVVLAVQVCTYLVPLNWTLNS